MAWEGKLLNWAESFDLLLETHLKIQFSDLKQLFNKIVKKNANPDQAPPARRRRQREEESQAPNRRRSSQEWDGILPCKYALHATTTLYF
jgi:hypothetical protein